jgi:hypothetical protein
MNPNDRSYQPSYNAYTIEELVDQIQQDITVGFALPKTLPDSEIIRFVETRAKKWFYQNYMYAVSKVYYVVRKECFSHQDYSAYGYITLPEEIQSINWIYEIQNVNLYSLGLNTPNLSVNLGVTNQPYLSSYVTTIGELGIYKVLIDSMSDMLNQLNKYTVRFQYNYDMRRLNVLTSVDTDLVLEAYANIPAEHLYTDPYFIKYITGWSKRQLGNLLGRLDFNLPGGVKYNAAALVTEGKEEMTEVETDIKGMSNSAWFFSCKR